MPHLLNKERIELEFYRTPERHDNYSQEITDPSFLVPAKTHNFASSRMEVRSTEGGANFWRKTLAFRSFQMVQEMSMVREVIALQFGLRLSDRLSHHPMVESSRCESEVLT